MAVLEVWPGECLPINLELEDDDGAMDLTGYSASLELKWDCGSLESTPTIDGAEISDTFTAAETENLPTDKKVELFLHLTEPSGCVNIERACRVKVLS